jgi:hypothetical protein
LTYYTRRKPMSNYQRPWTDADRFAYGTQRLRAATIPSRRHDGPHADEWAWDTPTHHCPECGREFDLTDPVDADEAANGHDCEAV